jgi:hypothetical protein
MAARRSEQSQLSGQAVAACNILRAQNQGLLYKRTPSEKTIRGKRVLWWGLQINSERHIQKMEIIGVRKTCNIFSPIFKMPGKIRNRGHIVLGLNCKKG